MRKIHKIISLLCAAVLIFALTACGASGDASGNADSQSASTSGGKQAESAEPTEVPKESVTEEPQTEQQENVESTEGSNSTNILVAYFSATGNTRPIAETIAELTGGDLFEIVPADPYTDEDLNYSNDDCRANQEQNDSAARPEISGTVENMDDYDVVLIGHPIWWGEEPRIMDTFMESYDFSGKTAVNFCTSGGSGVSTSTENLKALSPNANWLEGHRFETGASEDDIQEWLTEIGILGQN